MSHTYMDRRKAKNNSIDQTAPQATAHGPSMQELAAGAAPSQEQMGHRVDLPEAIQAKMEASFGADFSSVKLYESQTVADAGADAMTIGSSIGFAPGKLNFSSTAGQTMLGHELSHVVTQARGEVHGQGFLNDHALEARADREGALAAAGESVYAGPVAPLSASAIPAATTGVAQAWGKTDQKKKLAAENNDIAKAIDDADRQKLLEGVNGEGPITDEAAEDMNKRRLSNYIARTSGDTAGAQETSAVVLNSMGMDNSALSDDTRAKAADLIDAGSEQRLEKLFDRLNDSDEREVLKAYRDGLPEYNKYKAIMQVMERNELSSWSDMDRALFQRRFALLERAMGNAKSVNDYYSGKTDIDPRKAMNNRRKQMRNAKKNAVKKGQDYFGVGGALLDENNPTPEISGSMKLRQGDYRIPEAPAELAPIEPPMMEQQNDAEIRQEFLPSLTDQGTQNTGTVTYADSETMTEPESPRTFSISGQPEGDVDLPSEEPTPTETKKPSLSIASQLESNVDLLSEEPVPMETKRPSLSIVSQSEGDVDSPFEEPAPTKTKRPSLSIASQPSDISISFAQEDKEEPEKPTEEQIKENIEEKVEEKIEEQVEKQPEEAPKKKAKKKGKERDRRSKKQPKKKSVEANQGNAFDEYLAYENGREIDSLTSANAVMQERIAAIKAIPDEKEQKKQMEALKKEMSEKILAFLKDADALNLMDSGNMAEAQNKFDEFVGKHKREEMRQLQAWVAYAGEDMSLLDIDDRKIKLNDIRSSRRNKFNDKANALHTAMRDTAALNEAKRLLDEKKITPERYNEIEQSVKGRREERLKNAGLYQLKEQREGNKGGEKTAAFTNLVGKLNVGGTYIRQRHDELNELYEAKHNGEWEKLKPGEQKAWIQAHRSAYLEYLQYEAEEKQGSTKHMDELKDRNAKRTGEVEKANAFLEEKGLQLVSRIDDPSGEEEKSGENDNQDIEGAESKDYKEMVENAIGALKDAIEKLEIDNDNVGDGLDIIGQLIGASLSVGEVDESVKTGSGLKQQKEALGDRGKLSGVERLLRDIATQGLMRTKQDAATSAGDAIEGGFGAVKTILGKIPGADTAASLVGAIGTAGAAASRGVGALQGERITDKVMAQTTGISDEDVEEFNAKYEIGNKHRAKQALMKALGYRSGTRAELFAEQTTKRSEELVKLAKAGNQSAMILAMLLGGWDEENESLDPKRIAKSLGLEEDQSQKNILLQRDYIHTRIQQRGPEPRPVPQPHPEPQPEPQPTVKPKKDKKKHKSSKKK